MRYQACLLALLAAVCLVTPVAADEIGFLKPLNGSWTGTGKVLRKIGDAPINVFCRFTISAPGSSISMRGNCRGLLIISRAILAQLTARGNRYSGTYTGPSGAISQLSGSRQGDIINLAVRWARLVNGDRDASMTIRRQGDGQLTLRTIDKDLSSGKSVVTSEINLHRQ
ncbi:MULTISPECIES: hypothetical protein [unclassified Rhizobium]|uniref:hypothetical protein n=1 Tax=Rhizobium TaxID=379 RepID=UPI00084C1086|nr:MULTISPECIES: hypothetical protein [unclassified Rhizobium]OEC95570.1 hypothetical protein A9Z06_30865 [Rhizobium sp. YK2]QYA15182.1 hypothetical protein J5284_25480 [Rhizobium sp. AB2/73]UEQ83951.1 hypothetical protein I8E17_21670 [Rhizobium sp. AB2/73]